MHEQSETVQRDGKWVNVFGRGTPQAGRPLPRRHEWERDAYDTADEAVAAAKRRSAEHGFRYGDANAMRLMKWAKHDPETASVVHAVRRLAPDVTIHTERWGQPDAPPKVRDMTRDENGSVWNVRGLYRPKDRTIDVHYNADANATLGHELVHHLLSARRSEIGGDTEELFADYMARQPREDWRKLPKATRHRLRDLAVEYLDKDIRRGGETDLTQRPDALARLNAKMKQERTANDPVTKLLGRLRAAGLEASVERGR
jgi:hypothetical protein